jgi:hypothetical protein
MEKRYFWVLWENGDGRHLMRYRNQRDQFAAIVNTWGGKAIPATHPEVRRIQRRIAAGEVVEFPVKIEDTI